MTKIKEVIVVEGRDDTARLHQVLGDVDTIETNGSEISDQTIELIRKAQNKRGVIVITDPDFNGERIRRKIVAAVPGVKQAFLRRQDSVPSSRRGSLGLEHASSSVIKKALSALWTTTTTENAAITAQNLIDCGLVGQKQSRRLRELVGDILHIGYANSKQFQRRLAMFKITLPQLTKALQQAKEELHDS
ncbi:ribonuclease M5 [Bombilactobacillus thymidiniphilus]|uniref:Ribonuclease M5 n=1 Tax=Bombilactobacillus thymidiniphilus TaxID=2923363 RepID=A0ABY4PEV8_9LACO|nr:ribonuclease M5 [Bombilactobacillus thymidiniphilus]UQS84051.1 ribonuclease M5 [Bombilactobacillus thymidiniphilus]